MRALVAAESGNSGSGGSSFLLLGFVVLLGLLLFVSSRRKRRQAVAQQESLQVGWQVSTTSGLLGTLVALDDKTAKVRVSPGVELEFIRRAIVPRSALLPGEASDVVTGLDGSTDGEPMSDRGTFSLEKDTSDGWGNTDSRGEHDPRSEA